MEAYQFPVMSMLESDGVLEGLSQIDCEDCGHVIAEHGPDGCQVIVANDTDPRHSEPCSCQAWEVIVEESTSSTVVSAADGEAEAATRWDASRGTQPPFQIQPTGEAQP